MVLNDKGAQRLYTLAIGVLTGNDKQTDSETRKDNDEKEVMDMKAQQSLSRT